MVSTLVWLMHHLNDVLTSASVNGTWQGKKKLNRKRNLVPYQNKSKPKKEPPKKKPNSKRVLIFAHKISIVTKYGNKCLPQ